MPQILDHGPKVLMGIGATISITWWGAVEAQSTSGRLSFHSGVFYFAIFLVVVGFVAWVIRAMVNDKKKSENTTTFTTEEVQDVRRLLAATGKEPPKELAAMKVESSEEFEGTLTLPPGGIVASAIGVGPLKVSVPSGKPFGADPDKPFEFTTNSDPQRIVLAEGGTVTAYLSGTASGHFEFTGKADATVSNPSQDEQP